VFALAHARLVLVLVLHRAAHVLEDRRDLRLEAHVKHAVGLVEHDVRALVEHEVAAVEHVLHAPGGAHDDVHALPQVVRLLLHVHAADDRERAQVRVGQQLGDLLVDLVRELARGRHDDGQRPVVPDGVQDGLVQRQQVVAHGDPEGRRLAGPRLGDACASEASERAQEKGWEEGGWRAAQEKGVVGASCAPRERGFRCRPARASSREGSGRRRLVRRGLLEPRASAGCRRIVRAWLPLPPSSFPPL
jgi:hypothetical protein